MLQKWTAMTADDCNALAPLQGVTVTAKVEREMNTGATFTDASTTDTAGHFRVHLNEVRGTWVTLMFREQGDAPLDKQHQGSSSQSELA